MKLSKMFRYKTKIGLVFLFISLFSCVKNENQQIDYLLIIDLENDNKDIYKYDNYIVKLKCEGELYGTYILSINLRNCHKEEEYKSIVTDTIKINDLNNRTQNLRDITWINGDVHIKFDDLPPSKYSLEYTLSNIIDLKRYRSNILQCEINRKNPDATVLDNIQFNDIEHNNYNLVEILNEFEYLLFFEFATGCGWSRLSISQINSLTLAYQDKMFVIGVEGSETPNSDKLKEFIINNDILFPVITRIDNPVMNNILHPDLILSFPRIIAINKKRRLIYRQTQYYQYLNDSISLIMNTSL